MSISSVLSISPNNIEIFLTIIFVIIAVLVFYALYKKGDVRAVFSYGKTVFELEAKERQLGRKEKTVVR